ncbi:MAG TPA: S8 family serine peptidase [Solirubrobacterales bacterium]|nr:S8 family serine peptidase [Solirubrobacterales bacterium]
MTKWFRPRRRRPQRWLLAAALSASVLTPPPAVAMQRLGPNANLSPRLAELATPAVQGLSHAAQARRLGVAVNGPGSLVREGNRVLVEMSFDHGAIAQLDALRAAGGRVVSASRRYQTVTVAAPPDALHGLADVDGVGSVQEVRAPIVYGAGEATTAAVGANCEGGSIVSEGAGPPQDQLHVTEARSKYDVDGSGVTVGVLSDSYDKATKAATHAKEDVASRDLPGPANECPSEKMPVEVIEDFGSSSKATDEGRAMLQIVHDVAPAANLAFATAFTGEQSFAQNIERLAKPVGEGGAGADVIVDDVAYFHEPFFQDGPVAAAISKVTSEGVAYFSAAGNDNLFDSNEHEIASWEAPEYRDAHSCPAPIISLSEEFEEFEEKIIEEEELTGVEPQGLHPDHCMNFKPTGSPDTEFGLTVERGRTLTVDLQWAEPWYEVTTDLDAFLVNEKGEILEASLEDNAGDPEPEEEGATQKPVEVLEWENTTKPAQEVRLIINRFSGSSPRLKFAFLENGRGVTETEYPEGAGEDVVGPTIFGHAASSSAVAVAAVPYNNSNTVEAYSSRGPVFHHFGPVIGTTAADPLPTPEEIEKPDVAATDGGATTFFSSLEGGEWRFWGTSAAAPHAAGIAALQLEAKPSATVEEIREAQTETSDKTLVGVFGKEAVGAGLLDADGTLAFLLPSTVSITKHPLSRTTETTPTFEFTPTSGLECFVDSQLVADPCSSPYTTSVLADGPHMFKAEASDGESASFSFTVDTTPPVITITKRPPTPTSDSTPSFSFATDEPANPFTCAVDGGSAQSCASSLTLDALEDGSHSLLITATDQVGNSSQKVVPFEIDTKAPSPAITESPPALSNDPRPSFAFSAGEPVAYVCSIDGEVPEPCASPFEVSYRLADGSHSFEVVATDLAGNSGRATATFAIDATPPQTFISSHPRKFIRASKRGIIGILRFRSNESNVVLACKIDRGLWHFCRTRIRRRFKPGRHTITVKAQDEAGNVDPTPAVYRFVVRHRR